MDETTQRLQTLYNDRIEQGLSDPGVDVPRPNLKLIRPSGSRPQGYISRWTFNPGIMAVAVPPLHAPAHLHDWIAIATENGVIRFYSIHDGSPVLSPSGDALTEQPYRHDCYTLAWGRDGRLAAGYTDGTIAVWNPETPQEPAWIVHGHDFVEPPDDTDWQDTLNVINGVTSVSWAQDGRLASGGHDTTIAIWTPLASHQPVRRFRGHDGPINAVHWGSGGRLASASADGTVAVWTPDADAPVWRGHGHDGPVQCVCLGPHGRLATGGDDYSVAVWAPAVSGTPIWRSNEHDAPVTDVRWGVDGRLASCGGSVAVWSAEPADAPIWISRTHAAKMVFWAATGELVTTAWKSITIYKPKATDPNLWHGRVWASHVCALNICPNGKIVTAANDLTVSLWDSASNAGSGNSSPSRFGRVGEERAGVGSEDSGPRSFPKERVGVRSEDSASIMGSENSSPSRFGRVGEERAGVGSEDSGASDGPIWTGRGHERHIVSVDCANDGYVAAAASDGTVAVWNPQSADTPAWWVSAHEPGTTIVRWGPPGLLATGGFDGTVATYAAMESDTPLWRGRGQTRATFALDWSYDGRIASGANVPAVWQPGVSEKPVWVGQQTRRDRSSVSCVRWGPDGLLASGTEEGTVSLWRPDTTDAPIWQTPADGVRERFTLDLAWSPCGTYLAGAVGNSNVFVLDAETGAVLAIYDADAEIRALRWPRDRDLVAYDTGGGSGRPHVHRLRFER